MLMSVENDLLGELNNDTTKDHVAEIMWYDAQPENGAYSITINYVRNSYIH